ncbi:MAG: hypothetical protein WD512_09765 [Candidatus Paceibacterota bacterium]
MKFYLKSAEFHEIRIAKRDCKNLLLLAEELTDTRKIIVCNEKRYLKTDQNIEIMPVEYFLQELWKHRIISFSPESD